MGRGRPVDLSGLKGHLTLFFPTPTFPMFLSAGGIVTNFKQQLLDKLEARTAQVGVMGFGYVSGPVAFAVTVAAAWGDRARAALDRRNGQGHVSRVRGTQQALC